MAELTLDNMNRILLPKKLTDMVSIDKEVVMLGQDGKIEIWAVEAYEKINNDLSDDDFAALAEKIMGANKNS
jgi:MraZ protein